jgi:hypothetical protein
MPELYEDLEMVWQIFWQLHSCRTYGYGPNPLAVGDIVLVFDLHNIESGERLEMFELIKAMDNEWLKWANEQSKGK